MTFALPALLILQLPFEWRTPLFQLGGVRFTNLELTAGAVLAVLGVRLVRARAPFAPLDWAACAWLAAWALAGLVAPVEYPAALTTAARLAVGPALFLVVRGTPGLDAARLGRGFALTGAIAASLGVLEAFWPAALASFDGGFRLKATVSSFGVRATGSFEHANQFSCFLELTLPFTLLALAGRDAGDRRRGWLQGAVILLGVVLGLSRAGWMAVAVAAGVTLGAGRRMLGPRRTAGLALGALLVLAVPFGLSTRLRGRLLWPRAEPPFAASYAFSTTPTPRIVVMNHGAETWRAAGPNKVVLSVHGRRLTPPVREAEVFLDLPEDVPRCGRTEVPIDPLHTLPEGRYLHVYEVLHPVWGYSSQWDAEPISGETEILGGRATLRYAAGHGALRRPFASRPELWRAAWSAFREHPWIGLGPGRFQESYERWLPQVEPDPRLHPNELYLHTLAEGGALAAGALALVIALAATALWKGLGAARTAPAAAAGAGLLAGWLAHGALDSFLLFNGCAYAFWIGLGLACRPSDPGAASAIIMTGQSRRTRRRRH